MRVRGIVASGFAVVIAILLGIVGPPSDFVSSQSTWWRVDPLMFPLLFAGVGLSVLALIASVAFRVRAGAKLCLLAILSSGAGLVIAEGIAAHVAWRFDAFCCALLAAPAVTAASVVNQETRGGVKHA